MSGCWVVHDFKSLATYSLNYLFTNARGLLLKAERVPFKGGLQTAQNTESTGTQSIPYFFPHTQNVWMPAMKLPLSYYRLSHSLKLFIQSNFILKD